MMFTTSWDDGHPLDLRIAELLRDHGMTGTFYIPQQHEYVSQSLSLDDIHFLSQTMEVGAHTLSHPADLTQLSSEELEIEVGGSKKWLESITEKECQLFCYPRGKYDGDVQTAVKRAGFRGARCSQNFKFSVDDIFAIPSSIHIYPFPFRPVLNRRCIDPLRYTLPSLQTLGISITRCTSWLQMAKAVFIHAYETEQPFFHLRGHSWEVEKYNFWKPLEIFLKFVRSKENIQFVPNSHLIT